MSQDPQSNAPMRFDYQWLIRRAIARRTPLPIRKWIMSKYHWFFLQFDKGKDLVELTINGRGEQPQVYFPRYKAWRHNAWRIYATHPPLRYTSYPLARLCHWVNEVPERPPKPCVAECEHILAVAGDITDWQHGLRNLDRINRLVAQDECRFVFTYSLGLMDHSRRYLHPDLWRKLGVVYAAFPLQPEPPRPPERPFTIFVIAGRFSDKGVPEALLAFRVLRQRHGAAVRLILVSQAVPPGYVLPEGVTHYNTPRLTEELKATLFRSAHVLVSPCYSDGGMPIIEAYAFGVPVIYTRIHHRETEIVVDGNTGYLIDVPFYSYSEGYGTRWPQWADFLAELAATRERGGLQPVVDQLVDRLAVMMSGGVDLAAMGRAARALHAAKFTPAARNAELRRIYQDAASDSAAAPG
ncbi:MAG: hypothetical protein QG637_862 [Chloroflexota bacterium]|nr:hypothetical protein [Chloroflexota bacterium]